MNKILRIALDAGMLFYARQFSRRLLGHNLHHPAFSFHGKRFPGFQNLIGLMNTQKPPLNDLLVRQAGAYAFPYDQFIEGVMGQRATQSFGPVPPGIWGHSDELFQYSYDLDKAAELLAEGLTFRQIRDKTGVSVTTVGRVARCLAEEPAGYSAVLKRMGLLD